MVKLCSLSIDKGISIVEEYSKDPYLVIKFRRGVWNPYTIITPEKAISGIENSSYGADIDYDEQENILYVSCPTNSDMW